MSKWASSLRAGGGALVGLVGLRLLAGCAVASDPDPNPTVGDTASAIVGGNNDEGSDEANVVVRVQLSGGGYCTGTLVSPRLVLTAAHCFHTADCAPKETTGDIYLGLRYGEQRRVRQPPSTAYADPIGPWSRSFHNVRTLGAACAGSGDAGRDVALVYLDGSELTPKSRKPSFNPGVGLGSVTFSSVLIAGWSPIGVAPAPGGVPYAELRQASRFVNAELSRSTGNGGYYWEHTYDPMAGQTRIGDSGGPLFLVAADGTRDVIGVLAGGADNENPQRTTGSEYWADITRLETFQWINENAADSLVNGGHSAAWLAQHGKHPSFWFGEVDYTGSCRKDVDDDCDGWFDKGPVVHDNCLHVANTDQKDTNGDGIGDACQRCPWDPNNDQDGDGVCGDGPGRPPTAAVDNCPRIANPAQANCNLDSEVQRAKLFGVSPVIRGDVCDPVPCPRVIHTQSSTIAHGSGYDPEWGGTFHGRTIMDQVAPRPIPSHVSNATVARPVDNGALLTHARFCQNDPQTNWTCMGKAENFRDELLFAFGSASEERNELDFPWHRVMHDPGLPVRGGAWPWPYTAAAMNGAAGLGNARWDYQADAAEWAARDLIPTPPNGSACLNSVAVGEGTCLDGVMWYHADTTAGRTADTVNGTFVGLHGGDDQVANFYTSWRPDDAFIGGFKGYGRYKKLFWWQKLFAVSPFDVVQKKTHARPIAIDEARAAHMLHDNGAGQELEGTPMATLSLSKMLGKDIVVAASHEPLAVGASLDSRIEAAIVSDDGHTVIDTVAASAERLALGSELGIETAASVDENAPSPRHGFTTFLSPSLGAVVVLGGTDLATGSATSSLHLYRFGQGWSAPTLTATLGTVRAATYSPRDGMIWVLDTPAAGKLRVLRISPFTGAVSSGGTFAWDEASHVRQGLGVAEDGSVLLYTSTSTSSRIATLAIVAKKAVAVTFDQLEGAHDGDIFASNGETNLLVVDAGERTTKIDRITTLDTVANRPLAGFFE